MTATGIERKLDELGRVVLPKSLRRTMQLETGTPMRIYVEGNRVILEKGTPECALCGSVEDIVDVKGRDICTNCIASIKKQG